MGASRQVYFRGRRTDKYSKAQNSLEEFLYVIGIFLKLLV